MLHKTLYQHARMALDFYWIDHISDSYNVINTLAYQDFYSENCRPNHMKNVLISQEMWTMRIKITSSFEGFFSSHWIVCSNASYVTKKQQQKQQHYNNSKTVQHNTMNFFWNTELILFEHHKAFRHVCNNIINLKIFVQ